MVIDVTWVNSYIFIIDPHVERQFFSVTKLRHLFFVSLFCYHRFDLIYVHEETISLWGLFWKTMSVEPICGYKMDLEEY